MIIQLILSGMLALIAGCQKENDRVSGKKPVTGLVIRKGDAAGSYTCDGKRNGVNFSERSIRGGEQDKADICNKEGADLFYIPLEIIQFTFQSDE